MSRLLGRETLSDQRDGRPAAGAARTRHAATAAIQRDGSRPATNGAGPLTRQRSRETQAFGTIVQRPIALAESVCADSVKALNQVLADTMALRDLYKKHHWQVAGETFSQLHQLFDKHYEEQATLIDAIAERVQLLGGVSITMAADVAEITRVPRPPRGREAAPGQLARLLEARS